MSPPTLPRPSKNETYPLNYLSKKLNNRAAYQITTKGNYEEGINILTKALRLNERSMIERKNESFCTCKFCCIDSDLVLEEEKKCLTTIIMDIDNDVDSNFDNNKKERHSRNNSVDFSSENTMDCDNVTNNNNNDTPFTHRRQQQMKKTHDSSSSSQRVEKKEMNDDSNNNNDDGFVYRRLLLVNNRSIEEDHFMGATLSLIIIFNLALAHHLMSIDITNNESLASSTTIGYCSTNNKKLNALQRALKLYELAYQLHIKYIEHLSQCNTLTTTDDDDDDDEDDGNGNHTKRITITLHLTMIFSNNLGQIHRVAGNTKKHIMCLQHLLNNIMYMGQQSQHVNVLDSKEFDGFFHNISPIVFNGVCASAA